MREEANQQSDRYLCISQAVGDLNGNGKYLLRIRRSWLHLVNTKPIMTSRDYFLEDYIRTEDSGLDQDGQPHPGLNANHRLRRGLSEMLGLCKGFLADGQLADSEINFLNVWFQANQDVVCDFPAREIYARIQRVIRDGIVTDEEREDLAELISKACGGKDGPFVQFKEPEARTAKVYNTSTAMPFDDPEPQLQFAGQGYSFTGKFVSGTRNWCAEQVTKRGGRFDDVPNARTNVRVIGSLGSRDWAHTKLWKKDRGCDEVQAANRHRLRGALGEALATAAGCALICLFMPLSLEAFAISTLPIAKAFATPEGDEFKMLSLEEKELDGFWRKIGAI